MRYARILAPRLGDTSAGVERGEAGGGRADRKGKREIGKKDELQVSLMTRKQQSELSQESMRVG